MAIEWKDDIYYHSVADVGAFHIRIYRPDGGGVRASVFFDGFDTEGSEGVGLTGHTVDHVRHLALTWIRDTCTATLTALDTNEGATS